VGTFFETQCSLVVVVVVLSWKRRERSENVRRGNESFVT